MKSKTYDAISTIALVSVVVFTIASQHSSRGAYVFGVLAIVTAAGLFVAYIKASSKRASTDDQTTQAESKAESEAEIAARREALSRNVRDELYRKVLLTERDRAANVYRALFYQNARLAERQLMLFHAPHHGTARIKGGSYYTQIRIHAAAQDPASIITNIIEKLCAGSKEPRFEFILEPDGRFKIQQVSAKRAAVVERIAPQEEKLEQPEEPAETQLIN